MGHSTGFGFSGIFPFSLILQLVDSSPVCCTTKGFSWSVGCVMGFFRCRDCLQVDAASFERIGKWTVTTVPRSMIDLR